MVALSLMMKFLNSATSQLFIPGPRNTTLPALPTKLEYWPLLPIVFTGGSVTTLVLKYSSTLRWLRGRIGFPVSRARGPSVPPVRSTPLVFMVTPRGAPRTKDAMPDSCQLSNAVRMTWLSHSLLAPGMFHNQLILRDWLRSKPAKP